MTIKLRSAETGRDMSTVICLPLRPAWRTAGCRTGRESRPKPPERRMMDAAGVSRTSARPWDPKARSGDARVILGRKRDSPESSG